MVRHADRKMLFIKGEVYTHRSLEAGGTSHHTGLHGETPVSVRRQGEKRGEHGPKPLLGFSSFQGKVWAKHGSYSEQSWDLVV